jgi:acetylornithine/N-succinyldiaminopimelate aminotransferase
MLLALDLKRDIASRVVDLARDDGLLLNAPRANFLRFMPALNLKVDEIDMMLATLEACIRRCV